MGGLFGQPVGRVNGGGAVKLTYGLLGPRMGRPAPPSITIQGLGVRDGLCKGLYKGRGLG